MKILHFKSFEEDIPPTFKVCKCEQCRGSKNKRHNKNARKKIKRMLNKHSRKANGKFVYHMWS